MIDFRKLSILCLVCLAFALGSGPIQPAQAAEFTEVMDANDINGDFWDMRLSVGFRQEYEWAVIARERNTVGSTIRDMIDQDEFNVHSVKQIMDINARAGLYKNLEMHLTVPIHLHEEYSGKMSVHWRDKWWAGEYNPQDLNQKGRPSLQTDKVLRYSAWTTQHNGLGDMILGFTYGILDEGRDSYRPDLNLTMDLQLPTGGSPKPVIGQDENNRERGKASGIGVGSQVFAFIFKLATSKRFGIWEPYFELNLHMPIAAGSFLKDPIWEGGGLFGMEFIAYEYKAKDMNEPKWRFAFDWRLGIQYFGEGQGYNIATDAFAWRAGLDNQPGGPYYWPVDLREGTGRPFFEYPGAQGTDPSNITAPKYHLPTSGSHAKIHSRFGISGILGHYFFFNLWSSVAYKTEYFFSIADKVDPVTLRPSNPGDYYAQINEVGTRVKISDDLMVSWMLELGFQY